jgi:orotate phosphoribosyltransferase
VTAAVPAVGRAELRLQLAADLGRGGYVYRDAGAGTASARYFDKALVLGRPGLLTRSARLLADLLPADCERLAVTGVGPATLGTALSQQTGVPLLLGQVDAEGRVSFDGEAYAGVATVLLEDVVFTGQRALAGLEALRRERARVLGVVCLLDRERGAARVLADAGASLRALFTEGELLHHAHGGGR